MSKVQVHVGNLADMGARFAGAWNRAAAGEQVNETHVTFLDVQTMLDTLTPKDALNNSFPGVLRLGYFSDGANLS